MALSGITLDYNYRMNEPTAAIGLAQLEILPNSIEQLRANAVYYDQAVENCNWLCLQRGPDAAHHSFYHWVATFTGDESGLSLEDFKRVMSSRVLHRYRSVTRRCPLTSIL